MLKKFKEWIGTGLDVYKVENANDIAPGLVRHIWKGEETATQIGTTLKAQIMNDLQKGLVHTLNTTRTTGMNKDIYEAVLGGIEEFGVFDGLKLLTRIDRENQYDDVFLRLGGVEYPIYKIKENTVKKLNKGDLKEKKEYLLNYNNNFFVLSDSVLYGTQPDTVLEGNRLAEIIGMEFGGNIQDTGIKTAGKFYYDIVTKFYYECIEDNSLTYNDSGKFRAISNKPISDKVENLPRFYAKTTNIYFLNDRFTIKIPKSNFIFGILAVSHKTYGWRNKIIFTEGESCFEYVSSVSSQRLVITTDSQNVYLSSQDKNISLFLINSVTFFYYD